MSTIPPRPMPALFLAHGSPLLLDDATWMGELRDWARALPRPKAILVVSAHWERRPLTLSATRTLPLYYDFYGFPAKYYQVKYAAPGAPELAARVRALLGAPNVEVDEGRALDHGAYIPLIAMYPGADVPAIQLSLPTLDPASLLALGRALGPLRDEGVLILGSGFITHNLRAIDFSSRSAPPRWAADFDAWTADALTRRDAAALVRYREQAPGVRESLPSHEHFVPVLVTLGASLARDESASFPIEGFTYGSFSKRSVQLG